MTDADSLVAVGDDRAMVLETGGVHMLFAFGPAETAKPPEPRLCRVLAAPEIAVDGIRWGEQVHGCIIASLAAEPEHPLDNVACVGRCDALMTADTGLGLVVWTADCVPILIHGGGVVAAVHSGWRGSVADVAGAVVRRFAIEYGVPPGHLRAVLGPAVSGPRYEVSGEVVEGLRAFGLDENRWRKGSHVDLRAFLAARFEDLGLEPATIRLEGPCTASTPQLASYRRDGSDAGRQWSMIYRTSSS